MTNVTEVNFVGPCVFGLSAAEAVRNLICGGLLMPTRASCRQHFLFVIVSVLLLVFPSGMADRVLAAPANDSPSLSATPPMGWNDWAHYQCNYTAQDILANAQALVKTGLAARGYDTVTIDDCWMQKDRDPHGDLQADLHRFPDGIEPIARAVHALGLKFGIYEDSGYATCGGFAGSGEPKGGGEDHFLQDAKLFASWGVDYLKLDGCNLYVPKGSNEADAYRKAYAAESAALEAVGRTIVFSESAPAYFQGTPEWYDVLSWVGSYGQLWREGDDMANYHAKRPGNPRFRSVLWNYAYNLPLGRFQKPGNWNDPDFIIGGDDGMNVAETRSQLALWSMMSSPLILSSEVAKLSPEAVAILGNKAVILVDQDALGRMATLVRRGPAIDILFKPLEEGEYGVAVLNRGPESIRVELRPADFGFATNPECRLDTQDLWNGTNQSAVSALQSDIAAHDTVIWRLHPAPSCGRPTRIGTITMIAPGRHRDIASYSLCLAAPGHVGTCAGTPEETWTVTASGALKSAEGRCLAVVDGKPEMQACGPTSAQYWNYTLAGNLIDNENHECLSAGGPDGKPQSLSMQACGHNQPNQIWSLPN
ncbi:MAG TPA: ricin-type beta-trefoil lectin domain protein [Terriglobia bacterium]|nr:ricin-type beta-trefoil lectin domain protein [Terriglobia bacterium]